MNFIDDQIDDADQETNIQQKIKKYLFILKQIIVQKDNPQDVRSEYFEQLADKFIRIIDREKRRLGQVQASTGSMDDATSLKHEAAIQFLDDSQNKFEQLNKSFRFQLSFWKHAWSIPAVKIITI